MKSVNTYGMMMKGLRKASGYTKTINNGRVQINYDMETGDVIYTWHLNESSWTEYRENSVIHIVTTRSQMTMQQIADAIRDKVDEYRALHNPV